MLAKHNLRMLVISVLLLSSLILSFPVRNEAQLNTSLEVKVMTYNIEVSGEDPAWKDVVKEENADIITFVETGDWDDNNNQLLDEYCEEFNSYFTDEQPYECVGTEDIPYDTSGEAIFSRYPIAFANQIPYVTLDSGASYDVSHDFLHAKISIADTELHVVASHLKCCSGGDNEEKREKQQEGIINYMDALGDIPLIYAGDLNSLSPQDDQNGDLGYGPVSMLLNTSDYRDKASSVHNFTDAYKLIHPNDPGFTYGHQNSYYESRIDYLFANQYVSDDIESTTTGNTVSADDGSDHYSVDMVLKYDGEDADGQTYTGEVSNDKVVDEDPLASEIGSDLLSEIDTDGDFTIDEQLALPFPIIFVSLIAATFIVKRKIQKFD